MKKRGTRFTDRTGEQFLNNQGYWVNIITYRGANDCDVQFDDGFIVEGVTYDSVKNGAIKNPYYLSVFGVGYFGEGIFKSKINGKTTDAYRRWVSMLGRCYNLKFHSHHTYKDTIVCEEWHNFQNFAKWFYKNCKEGFELDKDLLVETSKIYSPETCCFVPKEINRLFLKCDKSRGICPIGVHKKRGKFASQISIEGVVTFLGYFNTEEDAFQVYKTAREDYVKRMADKWRGQITEEVYEAMYMWAVGIND